MTNRVLLVAPNGAPLVTEVDGTQARIKALETLLEWAFGAMLGLPQSGEWLNAPGGPKAMHDRLLSEIAQVIGLERMEHRWQGYGLELRKPRGPRPVPEHPAPEDGADEPEAVH